MSRATLPSDVATQIAAALDDNPLVPILTLLQFELTLANHPFDRTTWLVYRDWLLERGCVRRAEQLDRELQDREPPDYTGPVRPDAVHDWAGL